MEDLLVFYQEEGQKQKLKKWEDSVARSRELIGNCEDKLADLQSRGDPKDKTEVEEQIVLAKVRFVFVCLFNGLIVSSLKDKGRHVELLMRERSSQRFTQTLEIAL